MAITLDADRIKYKDYFQWEKGKFDSLWNINKSLINGMEWLNVPTDLETRVNYFNASSRFYRNAVLENIPVELQPYYPLVKRMVKHWSVTGEYCLVIENGVINTIRPDYVFPIRKEDNEDVITGFYFVFPQKENPQRARVVEFSVATGKAFQTERDFFSGQLSEASGGTPVNLQAVIYADTETGYYKHIEGLVREINVRYALMQLALNSTIIPLLQVATEGLAGGLVAADGITPLKIAGLGKTGIGLVIPPPFTGEEGARYIERAGTGLEECIGYLRILFGSLTIMSGVPEYVYGVSISQSGAEVERVMFMGESRVNHMMLAMQNTFAQLGVNFEVTPVSLADITASREVIENDSE